MEIIPKLTKLKKTSIGLNILFYFLIAVFLALIISYFILGQSLKDLVIITQDLEKVLELEKAPAEIALKQEIFIAQKKINDFSQLVKDRVSATNFFNFLETTPHSKIWFTGIDLDFKTAQAVIFGRAENFFVLGQQLMIFREELLIKETKLTGFKIGEEGRVVFEIGLSFYPQVFEFYPR